MWHFLTAFIGWVGFEILFTFKTPNLQAGLASPYDHFIEDLFLKFCLLLPH